MSDVQFVLAPGLVTVEFEYDPALIAVDSLAGLLRSSTYSGLPEWVYRVANQVTAEDKREIELLVDGFGNLFYDKTGEVHWPSFEAMVVSLRTAEPSSLVDRMFEKFCMHVPEDKAPSAGERAELLADVNKFNDWLTMLWEDEDVDRELSSRVHYYLQRPAEMQQFVVGTLRGMWDKYLAEEWKHVGPQVQANVEAFRKQRYRDMTVSEALRTVTGREMPGAWEGKVGTINRLVFVPAPHMGPYLVGLIGKTQARILFGAQPPRTEPADANVKSAAPAMSRSELLVRLNMLGDDVRLQILELLVHEQELCAQEIINRLDLSQSSASRHLAQLTATGYIKERRREVNKCYSLNRARIEDTLHALQAFFEKC